MRSRHSRAVHIAIVAWLYTSFPAWSEGDARDVFWKDLVPAAVKINLAKRVIHPGVAASSGPEARFMERKLDDSAPSGEAAVVTDFDGQRVRIGGYVVPLDFKSTTVTEFLLVPFFGACVHVPAPPANQILHITIDQGVQIKGPFEPVIVTGVLRSTRVATPLADAGYSLRADAVTPHRPYQD